MTLAEILREISALPATLPEVAEAAGGGGADAAPGSSAPLQVISKQGRLILRLSASLEALEARYKELAEEGKAWRTQAETAAEAARVSERRARQTALEAIHLMDALDWVSESVRARGEEKFAEQIAAAQRDCLRRLAAVGVTEIPAPRGSEMDGRLHEGLDAVTATGADSDVPRYHILSLVRRGYQQGPDVLRRAGVITAA